MSTEEQSFRTAALCQITGLSEKQLRRISQEGYFPGPSHGRWAAAPTLIGLFKYFRERIDGALSEYFDSTKLCAAATHIPVALQKSAKRAGCEAFSSGRVYLKPLLKWIFANQGKDDYADMHKKYLALIAQLEHERMAGKLVDRDTVKMAAGAAMSMIASELDRLFLTELPPALKGRDEQSIKARAKEAISQLWESVTKKFEQMWKAA